MKAKYKGPVPYEHQKFPDHWVKGAPVPSADPRPEPAGVSATEVVFTTLCAGAALCLVVAIVIVAARLVVGF